MIDFKHKQLILFELQKNCYLCSVNASLQYFANQEASIVLACLAVGIRERVIFLVAEHLKGDQKMSVHVGLEP